MHRALSPSPSPSLSFWLQPPMPYRSPTCTPILRSHPHSRASKPSLLLLSPSLPSRFGAFFSLVLSGYLGFCSWFIPHLPFPPRPLHVTLQDRQSNPFRLRQPDLTSFHFNTQCLDHVFPPCIRLHSFPARFHD